MKYYKTTDGLKLIQFNPTTNIYRVRNSVKLEDRKLTEQQFNELDTIKIGKQQFCELMNIFFTNVKHEWVYDDVHYKKMDNFERKGSSCSANYTSVDIPKHIIDGSMICIMIYHWGYVYYMTFDGNYMPKGQLVEASTHKLTSRWVDMKNVSPIFNKSTKEIM